MTSESLIDPPGWIIQDIPFLEAILIESEKGKKTYSYGLLYGKPCDIWSTGVAGYR